MKISSSVEVKRSSNSIRLLCWESILFSTVGGIQILLARQFSIAVICFLAAIILGAECYWGKKTPYLRVTQDEIMLFAAMMRPPTIFQWEILQEIYIFKRKIEFLLTNGKRAKIALREVDKEDLKIVLPMLQKYVREKDKPHNQSGN